MPSSNSRFLQSDHPSPLASSVLPPWLASSSSGSTAAMVKPPSPSVTLSLSPLTVPQPSATPWPTAPQTLTTNLPSTGIASSSLSMESTPLITEIIECCRELEEGHRAWTAHRKEAAWRLKRVELQLESEKASKRREKIEDIDAKINALREEQKAALDRIEAEYREQLMGLRREAEAKEQKLAEQWTAKHARLMLFMEQMGCRGVASEANGR